MNRTSMWLSLVNSTKSRISSSLRPRMTTQLTLTGLNPLSRHLSIEFRTLACPAFGLRLINSNFSAFKVSKLPENCKVFTRSHKWIRTWYWWHPVQLPRGLATFLTESDHWLSLLQYPGLVSSWVSLQYQQHLLWPRALLPSIWSKIYCWPIWSFVHKYLFDALINKDLSNSYDFIGCEEVGVWCQCYSLLWHTILTSQVTPTVIGLGNVRTINWVGSPFRNRNSQIIVEPTVSVSQKVRQGANAIGLIELCQCFSSGLGRGWWWWPWWVYGVNLSAHVSTPCVHLLTHVSPMTSWTWAQLSRHKSHQAPCQHVGNDSLSPVSSAGLVTMIPPSTSNGPPFSVSSNVEGSDGKL